MNIGEVIKEKRLEKGLSQKQLAMLVGCAEITIRQYENGSREPRFKSLEKIAEQLGTTGKALMIIASIDDNGQEVNIVEPQTDILREEIAALRFSLNDEGLVKTKDYMYDLMGNPKYKIGK